MDLKKHKHERGLLEIILIEVLEIALLVMFYYIFIEQKIKLF